MLEDVGSYLALHWIPTRLDGQEGSPCFACSSSRVVAGIINNPIDGASLGYYVVPDIMI